MSRVTKSWACGLLTTLWTLHGAGQEVRDSQPPEGVQSVRSASEARASSADERAAATYYDRTGRSLLSSGELEPAAFDEPALPVFFVDPAPSLDGLSPEEVARVLRRHEQEVSKAKAEAAEAMLTSHICRSDAVAIGRPTKSRTMLTASDTALFAHYVVQIDRWITPSSDWRKQLDIAYPGGRLIINDKLYSTTIAGLRPPSLQNGYLFLMKAIPRSAWYAVTEAIDADDNNRSSQDASTSLYERAIKARSTCPVGRTVFQ